MLIVTGGALTGLWIVARAWTHRRSQVPAGDVERLSASVERLSEGIERMQIELADLSERLDFTERALARLPRGSDVGRIGDGPV